MGRTILSALNNFLYADKLNSKLISQDLKLDSRFFTAYLTQNGKIIDIFDKQNKIINTTVIDDCSTLLNQQYDSLYQSEYRLLLSKLPKEKGSFKSDSGVLEETI